MGERREERGIEGKKEGERGGVWGQRGMGRWRGGKTGRRKRRKRRDLVGRGRSKWGVRRSDLVGRGKSKQGVRRGEGVDRGTWRRRGTDTGMGEEGWGGGGRV